MRPALTPEPEPLACIWPTTSLCSCIGTKTTLLFAERAICCTVSSSVFPSLPSLEAALTSLQLPDLHRRRRSQDICRLPHQARRVDLRPRRDDLTLTQALLLRGGGQARRNLGREDDVLDEDALDGYTPLVRDVADDLGNLEGDGLALGDDGLDGARADDVAEGGLRALDEGLAEVADAEGSAVGVGDLEVDDRVAERGLVACTPQ